MEAFLILKFYCTVSVVINWYFCIFAFREFIQALDPCYVAHLPTRQILSEKLVPGLYEELRCDVKKQLQQSMSRAVTVELWTNDRSVKHTCTPS